MTTSENGLLRRPYLGGQVEQQTNSVIRVAKPV